MNSGDTLTESRRKTKRFGTIANLWPLCLVNLLGSVCWAGNAATSNYFAVQGPLYDGRPLPDSAIPRLQQLHGLGTLADFSFYYYRNRSPRGLAREIKARGFSWLCGYSSRTTPELVEAFHDEGMAFVLFLWGTIIYSPGTLSPPPPDSGKQVFVGGAQAPDANPVFYCPNSQEYVEWYRKMVHDQVHRVPADMIMMTESFLGEWGGPDATTYGCFCDSCRSRFLQVYPEETNLPDFQNPASPRYWKTNRVLYERWITFRADSVKKFQQATYDAVIQELPNVAIAGNMLAIDDPQGISKVREYNAQDVNLLANAMPWDFFYLQAHFPDWLKISLDAEQHIRSYVPFLTAIRSNAPKLRVGVTTDSGSNMGMRRSLAWLHACALAAKQDGFSSFAPYEYSISRFIYEEPPTVIGIKPDGAGKKLEVIFSKRVDSSTAQNTSNYTLDSGSNPSQVQFDGGNIATLIFESWQRNRNASIRIVNVKDDWAGFWFKSHAGSGVQFQANTISPNTVLDFYIP